MDRDQRGSLATRVALQLEREELAMMFLQSKSSRRKYWDLPDTFLPQFHKLICLLTQPRPLLKATASKQLVQHTNRILKQSVLMAFQFRNATWPFALHLFTLTFALLLLSLTALGKKDMKRRIKDEQNRRKVCKNPRFRTYPGPRVCDW